MCPASAPQYRPPATLHLHEPAQVPHAATLRRAVARWAGARGLAPPLITDVELAVYEALINAVEHAYAAGSKNGGVELRAHHEERSLRVTITDEGRWQPPRGPDPRHGRGLPLIRALTDDVTITPTPHGTTVTMSWHLPPGGASN
ncbi:ATP-binding protein [Amycolatopsis sp. NPDC051372]|uniref:ATP-binding protein n=1 Tax=unclassified Amycolatopsis TaxID=2618356 RepID=UPI00342E557C